MTGKEYELLALRTATITTETNVPEWVLAGITDQQFDLLHASLGAGSEAGELCDQVKKHLMYGRPLDEVNVLEEVGDLLWYAALACRAIGRSLDDAMLANIAKLNKRYGGKFSVEACVNRDLDGEREALEGQECSICRSRHGREITHECE